MIKKKPVDNLVIGLIGDMIGGYIHPELEQTNSMSPMRGVNFVKSLIISGLKYYKRPHLVYHNHLQLSTLSEGSFRPTVS